MSNDNPYAMPQHTDKHPQEPQNPENVQPSPTPTPSAAEWILANFQNEPSQTSPGSNSQAPHASSPNPGTMNAPKDLSVAYAFLCFLGIFGAHKFYLGQQTQGWIYLGAWLASALLSIAGVGLIIFLVLMVMIYADIRTMQEQLERSARGEKFADPFEFLKKTFNS